MQVHYHSTISNSLNKITLTGDNHTPFFITMTKLQWTMLTIGGIIVVLGYNFGLAIRDSKGITTVEKPIYQSIPVIPYSE